LSPKVPHSTRDCGCSSSGNVKAFHPETSAKSECTARAGDFPHTAEQLISATNEFRGAKHLAFVFYGDSGLERG
jgi:hypothetical protein